jgi:hypothetical protein
MLLTPVSWIHYWPIKQLSISINPNEPRRKGGAAAGALSLGIEDLGTWTSVKKMD